MGKEITNQWMTEDRDEWLKDVRLWVSEAVSKLDLGDLQSLDWVQERHWSAVLRVTTPRAIAYFKAGAVSRQNDPRLLGMLRHRWTAHLPTLLASDEARSWMLMEDHGQSLREVADPAEQVTVWERLLPAYAEMQQASMSEADEWIGSGVPDRRVSRLPALLRELIAGETVAGTLPLQADERSAIEKLLPAFEARCAELAALPFAAALDHGDLHSGNVLARGSDYRLCDWGDSSVTHPFCSLLVTYQLSFGAIAPGDRPAAARRLRDAYLEAWDGYLPRKVLEPIFGSALWVAHVVRALDWAHLLDGADPAFAAKWRGYIAELLGKWRIRHEFIDRHDGILGAIL